MERTQMKLHVLSMIALVVCIFLPGCYRGPDATKVYGRAANPDRKARGIPVIPDAWIERRGGDQADWGNPAFADPVTTRNLMHTGKETFLDKSGNPEREYDNYQSGKQYTAIGGDPGELFPETLTINYDFKAAKEGKNPWRGYVNCGPLERVGSGPDLTLDQCEAILKEWGLKRLD